MHNEITVSSSQKTQCIDITHQIQEYVKQSGVQNGICTVFSKHTSAAITLNENTDPEIPNDIHRSLTELVPPGKWKHDRMDGNGDAHIKATIIGPSETVPIKNNQLDLGTWQAIMFVECDGPRQHRKIALTILGK